MMKTAFIVFCSPAGSTRHVAGVIAERLKEKSITVHQLDLGIVRDASRFIETMIRQRVETLNEKPPTQIFL